MLLVPVRGRPDIGSCRCSVSVLCDCCALITTWFSCSCAYASARCFFHIELPNYSTEERMRWGLSTAIHYGAAGILSG
jgi:hypothetical protein